MASENQAANFSSAAIPTVRMHVPDEIDGYWVSEDQLSLLGKDEKDLVWEFLLLGLGAAVGALPSTVSSIVHYTSSEIPYHFPLSDLIQLLIFCSGSVLFVATLFIHKRTRGDKQSVVGQIRANKDKGPRLVKT